VAAFVGKHLDVTSSMIVNTVCGCMTVNTVCGSARLFSGACEAGNFYTCCQTHAWHAFEPRWLRTWHAQLHTDGLNQQTFLCCGSRRAAFNIFHMAVNDFFSDSDMNSSHFADDDSLNWVLHAKRLRTACVRKKCACVRARGCVRVSCRAKDSSL